MPVISPQRMQDRRDSILAAAREAFARSGFRETSVADIARSAGVSDGLVYRYFDSKRDLLRAVLTAFYERTMVDLEAIAAREAPFADSLRALLRRHLGAFLGDTDLCRLFIAEVRTATDYQGSPIHLLNRRYTSILTRLIETAMARGEVRGDIDVRLVRDVIFGAVEHLSWAAVNGRSLDVDRTAESLVSLILHGLVPPAPGDRP